MSGLAAIVETAKPLARRFEGWRPRRYKCPAGVWTQGYGHTGEGITAEPWSLRRGEAVLDADLAVYARAVLALSPNVARLPREVGAALTDFCFNLGVTRYKASTLRKRVRAEDWQGAAHELGKWVFGGGRKLPGLVKRRAAEAALILRVMQGAANDNEQAAMVAEARRILAESADPLGDLRKLLAA
jgi:lysozyme